jgi:hypothetical protein
MHVPFIEFEELKASSDNHVDLKGPINVATEISLIKLEMINDPNQVVGAEGSYD